MAMGRRQHRKRQEDLWVADTELASAPGHPFYERLNAVLDAEGFDRFVEILCAKFYAPHFGRPSLTPGIYFRSLLMGYFKGIGTERVSPELVVEQAESHSEVSMVNIHSIEELVADKGYLSGAVLKRVTSYGVRSYIPEKRQKGKRRCR
jgi:hypothetical protein